MQGSGEQEMVIIHKAFYKFIHNLQHFTVFFQLRHWALLSGLDLFVVG